MSQGLSRDLVGLAGDANSLSGGTAQDGAEVNAVVDAVDVKAFRLLRDGIEAFCDAAGATTAFKKKTPLGP
ncbi:MAG: hypothetical protein AAF213_13830 [Pseudomonadota bacterium]